MSYSQVSAPTLVKRSFAITLGLVQGYGGSAEPCKREDVCLEVASYLRARAQSGEPFLPGVVSAVGDVVYAYRDGDSVAHGCFEPAIAYSGEVSVLYAAHLTDSEVIDALNAMASHLGRFLGQTRVYMSYMDSSWVLQADGETTPTRN